MTEVVIVAANRTAIGAFGGGLAKVPAHKLGATVIKDALTKTGVDGADISEVIMGQILDAGQGQNPARQAAMAGGVPQEVPSWTLNQVCGSGLRSVVTGLQQILLGDADIVIAGGQENMSLAPHCTFLRNGIKMGNGKLVDTMIQDGLWDIFNDYHMGVTAENIANEQNISREDQDAFSANSQQKAEAAINAGKFDDEIVPVVVPNRKGDITIDKDEHPKAGVTAEGLGKLRPAFAKDGSVTAGSSSGINDGAACVMLMSADEAAKRGLEPLAKIVSWANAGVSPHIMGTAPIPASQKALEKAGWTVDDLDLIEANEAFAVQAISVDRGLGWDTSKVNVNGGAIALGHPIGASGTRILVTLLHEMKRQDLKKGLATLCIGGGMGITICVERE